jgi:hypothetical protein
MQTDPEIEYAERHHPREHWRILGVELLPFRTGHKNLLLARRSPFFCPQKELSAADLIFAIWVCSRPYVQAARGFSLRWKLWAFRMALKLKRNELLFWQRVEMFLDYLAETNAKPPGMRSNPEGETTLAPSLMILKRDLLTRYSLAEFWELPMAVAQIDRNAILELEGVVSWREGWTKNAERINQDELLKQQQAAGAKSGRADISGEAACP